MEPFDAVLMDIQMPEMDGLTATRRIRETPAWKDLPVIAMTAGVTDAERERMTACGMTDLLAKPIALDALAAVLGRWIARPTAAHTDAPAQEGQLARVAADPGQAPTLPGFDLPTLVRMVGDPTEAHALLRELADTVRDDADAIAQALARGETAEAGRVAHRLKGTAGNLRAMELSAAAARLEAELQAGQDPGPALDALRQAHAEALARIAGLPVPPTAPDAATGTADPAAVRRLVAELQVRLAKGLLVPQVLMSDLGAALPAGDRTLYRDLQRHLDQFDYRAAGPVLERLLPVCPISQVADYEG